MFPAHVRLASKKRGAHHITLPHDFMMIDAWIPRRWPVTFVKPGPSNSYFCCLSDPPLFLFIARRLAHLNLKDYEESPIDDEGNSVGRFLPRFLQICNLHSTNSNILRSIRLCGTYLKSQSYRIARNHEREQQREICNFQSAKGSRPLNCVVLGGITEKLAMQIRSSKSGGNKYNCHRSRPKNPPMVMLERQCSRRTVEGVRRQWNWIFCLHV
jgi:hypothetical protein